MDNVLEKLDNLLEYAPLADVPDVLPSSLVFPVIMFKLPKLPFDLLIGSFSFTSGGLTSPSKLPAVLPYNMPSHVIFIHLKTMIPDHKIRRKLTEASVMPFGEAIANGLKGYDPYYKH